MRFLDLVEQHDRVGAAPHRLGELAAFLVAHVARGRADEPCHAVFLHVLAHVDPDHGGLVVEEELRQGAAQLGLPHTGRPEENKRADRAILVAQPGAGAAHRVGDGGDCITLADYAAGDAFFHVDQLVAFALAQAGDGDTGPACDHLRDVVLGDFFLEQCVAALLDPGESAVVLLESA